MDLHRRRARQVYFPEHERVVITQQLDRFVDAQDFHAAALLTFLPLQRLVAATLHELGRQRFFGCQRPSFLRDRPSSSPPRHVR